MTTLDICLLHNPEYFLSHAKAQNPTLTNDTLNELRTEFYRRLRQAFAFLETQVQVGTIQYYGVSSNTCTAPINDPTSTSLSRILHQATQAAQDTGNATHHFRIVQFPMNLIESNGLFTPNTGPHHEQTALEFTQQEQLAVLINRPLNAIPSTKAGMLRLADPDIQPIPVTFEDQTQVVQALESEYRSSLARWFHTQEKGWNRKIFFPGPRNAPRFDLNYKVWSIGSRLRAT